jgi:hypothetical protein
VAHRYDVFVSYHRANAAVAGPLRDALVAEHLRVFFDEDEIENFEGSQAALEDELAQSVARRDPPTHKGDGPLPGETSCLSLVWAVLDLFSHANNAATFTDVDRQHLYRIK